MLKNIFGWFGVQWLSLVAIVAITGALAYTASLPYAYFQLMNWVVVGASILVVMRIHNAFLMWTFITMAVIFNPLSPIFLRADIWQLVDIVAIFFFSVSLFLNPLKR